MEKDETEEVRKFLITHFSKKIEQHIGYLFTVIGGFYTYFTVFSHDFNNVLYITMTSCFIALLSIWTLYTVGRMYYWSTFNQFLYTFKPIEIQDDYNKEVFK